MTIAKATTSRLKQFRRSDDGATLVELAIVLPLFFLIFFALIDFGRMAFQYVTAEKAMQLSARIAAVRPAACPGVPQLHVRATVPQNATPLPFGTSCNAGGAICASVGTVTCAGNSGNATAAEVWAKVDDILPPNATIANLRFTYAYDANLGFLGGPYVPMMTVELTGLTFQYGTPISGLSGMINPGGGSFSGSAIPFPSMSVSLPAEDLAQGEAG